MDPISAGAPRVSPSAARSPAPAARARFVLRRGGGINNGVGACGSRSVVGCDPEPGPSLRTGLMCPNRAGPISRLCGRHREFPQRAWAFPSMRPRRSVIHRELRPEDGLNYAGDNT
ncbi:hypothetical protein GW17_00034854 [Ensete ventricosum]|nr:hypothetical protein GW17_00034854 [Ensete ventricosum]RZR87037.1 hypothetical protein BHM03_00014346 [Ensete ventricosum]